MKALWNRLIWYPKQLLPLRYHTTVLTNGVRTHYDWNMFLGRCYNIETKEL